MIEVIDNFLDDKLSAKVEHYFENKLPWYFIDNISIKENEGLGNYGFYHVFVIDNKFTTTEHLPAVEPVISKIQEKVNLPKILRVRADSPTAVTSCKVPSFLPFPRGVLTAS